MRAPALLRRPLLLFTFPALFLIYHLSFTGKPLPSTTAPPSPCFPFDPSNPTDDFEDGYTGPRVRQATMLYEGDKDRLRSMYERCVATHVKHGQRWGVPTHVLGHTLYEEHSFFNKPAYLQSLIMMELAKPVVKRADWIVWFDGDSVIMNPEIPWSIFLPPPDFSNIHVLGTQDVNGFNAGMLMIRVDQWSVRALSEVLALHNLKPDVPLPFYDQSAIDWVFLQPHNRDHFLFQPRHWWNRYFFTGDGDEPGEMLLHFAGIGAVSGGSQEKEKVMRKYLERVENEPQNWSKDLSKTPYEKEIAEFWATVRKAQKALQKTASWLETRVENPNANQVLDLRKTLQEMLLRQTDRVDWMIGNTTQLEKLLRD